MMDYVGKWKHLFILGPLMMAFLCVSVVEGANVSCTEGKNCEYCEIPTYYNQELQIIPNPSGYRINDGMSATVYCRQRGKTFINAVLAVSNVSVSDIFFYEGITIACSKGVLTPSIFEDDSWCKYGCAKIPVDQYTVTYPDLTYQTDLTLAPVYTDSTKDIKVACKAGYSDSVGDKGVGNVRCTSTGYTGYIRNCVAGCDYPLLDGAHTLSVQPNYERGYAYYADDNTAVTVKCAGESFSIPIYCYPKYGWENTDLLTCAKKTSTATSVAQSALFMLLMISLTLF